MGASNRGFSDFRVLEAKLTDLNAVMSTNAIATARLASSQHMPLPPRKAECRLLGPRKTCPTVSLP